MSWWNYWGNKGKPRKGWKKDSEHNECKEWIDDVGKEEASRKESMEDS